MKKQMWDNKPYHSLDYYFKEVYGQKIYKIAIDGGMSCPNRDGVIDSRGCLFCSQGGSGEFSASMDRAHPDIRAQIEKGKLLLSRKYSGCVTKDMRVAKEEIFGPVVTLIKAQSYKEGIDLINQSEIGRASCRERV